MKRCRKCNERKPLEDFAPTPKTKNGRSSWCRVCTAAYHRDARAGRTKRCRNCKQLRPLATAFYRRQDTKDRYTSICKDCYREVKAVWRRENPAKVKAQQQAWTDKNRIRLRAQAQNRYEAEQRALGLEVKPVSTVERARRRENARFDSLLRKHGLTRADYNRMLFRQEGLCAICRQEPNGSRLVLDHNHENGHVRALLCDTCNTGLGMFKDNPVLCRAAAIYLDALGALGT